MFRKREAYAGTRLVVGLALALMLIFIVPVVPSAAHEGTVIEENHKVADVVAAFDALTDRGEWLGFRRSAGAPANHDPNILDGSSAYHFQGIARSPRVGIAPILYATRSGCPDCEMPHKSEGTLLVVEMGSRDKHGERLRSNRLVAWSETQDTHPDARDKVIKVINFDSQFASGRFDYKHPGGLQMVGDILAVPLEQPGANTGLPPGKVAFFDASQPANPIPLDYALELTDKAGLVGLTRLDDGRFFLVVTGGDGEQLAFYHSNRTSFFAPDFEFTLHSTIQKPQLEQLGEYWRFGTTTPQALNFVNEEGGKLYLIGSSNSCWGAPWHVCNFAGGDDMWLWEVTGFAPDEQVGLIGLRKDTKLLYSDGNLVYDAVFARQEANFNASGGAYVSPTGELLYYSTEYYFWSSNKSYHIRCGDYASCPVEDNYLRFVELHHNKVSHTGTCGLQFPPGLNGPYDINEGDTLILDFNIFYVEPWVHMFEDRDFVGICNVKEPSTESFWCSTVMMDIADQAADDYGRFKGLDGPSFPTAQYNGFNDQLSSFRWCGPPYTSLIIYGDEYFEEGDPGYIQCLGTGYVVEESFLDDGNAAHSCTYSKGVSNFNDDASSASLSWGLLPWLAPSLDVKVDWGEGVTETLSIPWNESYFRGEHLYADNPPVTSSDVYTITVTNLGSGSSETETTVTVHNVAPAASIDSITDATTGLEIGPGHPLPVAQRGMEVNVAGSFTDPGATDTHTATMEWGDGDIDYLGHVVSATNASHVYDLPGDYTITLEVMDDDGGVGTATDQIKVVDMIYLPVVLKRISA